MSNYRIVEKNEFYIQKKSKLFGWTYLYDIDSVIKVLLWIVIFFIADMTVYFIDGYTITFYLGVALILLFLVIRFSCRLYYKSFENAKTRVEQEVKYDEEKNIKKSKKKNPKIHYLNIKVERQEKLDKLDKAFKNGN